MKVGITGIASCGKTVFLTSLLWQLAALDSSTLTVSAKIGLHDARLWEHATRANERFPFSAYRDALLFRKNWPAKTKATHRFLCSIGREDWRGIGLTNLKRIARGELSSRQTIEFFDFAGERFADASIAAFDDYGDWSEHILQHIHSHPDYIHPCCGFLNLLDDLCSRVAAKNVQGSAAPCPQDISERLIYEYKLALAALILDFKPLISPSVFLLDESASAAPLLTKEELAASRLTGLTRETQFMPLPAPLRQAWPELAKLMARNYAFYRDKVALPLFKNIMSSQRLIVLIDIPSLLMGGFGRYNDTRQMLDELFACLGKTHGNPGYGHHRPDEEQKPGRWASHLLKQICQNFGPQTLYHRLQGLLGAGLQKIAFVAVKSDLVHSDDIANGRMESLLRQLTEQANLMLPDVECGYFVCSALNSTRPGSAAHRLIGRPLRNNPEQLEKEFIISGLPERWPEYWGSGEYRFTEVSPCLPAGPAEPPEEIGLGRIFDFLLTERSNP